MPILTSTAFLLRCPIVPDNEDPTIWFASDATAIAGGMPKKISNGVIKKPPPTPNVPDKVPTIIPNTRKPIGLIDISAMGK